MDKRLSGKELEPKSPGQEIADMLNDNFGEGLGFDDMTLQEIAGKPFEEAFETAYSYLVQAGQDPDSTLAPWMEKPEPR